MKNQVRPPDEFSSHKVKIDDQSETKKQKKKQNRKINIKELVRENRTVLIEFFFIQQTKEENSFFLFLFLWFFLLKKEYDETGDREREKLTRLFLVRESLSDW